jgi:hypothetical protein
MKNIYLLADYSHISYDFSQNYSAFFYNNDNFAQNRSSVVTTFCRLTKEKKTVLHDSSYLSCLSCRHQKAIVTFRHYQNFTMKKAPRKLAEKPTFGAIFALK